MKSIKIFLAVLLLTIGGLIYIGFRSESLLMFEWYEHIGGGIDIYYSLGNYARNMKFRSL